MNGCAPRGRAVARIQRSPKQRFLNGREKMTLRFDSHYGFNETNCQPIAIEQVDPSRLQGSASGCESDTRA